MRVSISDQSNVFVDSNGPVLRPVGRLSVEGVPYGVHDGYLGAGSSWTLNRMV